MAEFMKRQSILLVLVLVSLWVVGGCEDNNPVDVDEITGDLFPLATGRVWVSTAFELDTTGRRIESSEHREALYAQSTVTLAGKSAFLMVDSVYSTQGQLNFVDTTYLAVENNDLYLYLGGWMGIFQRSEGVNKEYVAGTFTISEFGLQIEVTVRCTIFPKEPVSVPMGTMDAYKVQVKSSALFGFTTIEDVQNVWFAEGVGPIKFQTVPTYDPFLGLTLNGSESVLVSTNF